MPKPYQVPGDLSALTDDELTEHLSAATKSFQSESQTTTVTENTLPTLRTLKAAIQSIKDEQSARLTAAQEAAAEIDALSAEVFGEPEVTADGEPEGEGDESPVLEGQVVASGSGTRKSLSLAAVRERQPKFLAAQVESERGIEIVASVDVPGFRPGQAFDLEDVTEGAIRRANSLKTAGGGVGMVASYMLPFADDLIVKDSSSAPHGSSVALKAADTRRLPGGSLVASGGWCAPSETVYAITDVACPDGLFTAPEIQLERGGIRFFQTPTLDVNTLTWVHTEADDIAGNTKPCFKIPCPAPVDVRCEAIGVCLEAGILTQRHFPELIDWYVRNSMVAHEIRVAAEMYAAARAASTAVTTTASFGSFSAVYAAVALQAADMIEKHHLCTELEVVFPFWWRNMAIADVARQQGVKPDDLDPNIINAAFARLGVRVQWAKGLVPDVPTNIGGTTPAVAWPVDVEFLIYPAGNFQIGRGAEVNLGVVHDSTKFSTNDYTATFTEECVALINRGIESRRVTVAVCASGQIGPQAAAAVCPIA